MNGIVSFLGEMFGKGRFRFFHIGKETILSFFSGRVEGFVFFGDHIIDAIIPSPRYPHKFGHVVIPLRYMLGHLMTAYLVKKAFLISVNIPGIDRMIARQRYSMTSDN